VGGVGMSARRRKEHPRVKQDHDSGPKVLRIKVISMGEGGSGKSCLIKRYCEEKFVSKYITTIGVDFGVKSVVIDDTEVKVNFWDLSGHPEFFDVRNEFYKDSQGGILVYDATSRKSFDALDSWMIECSKYGGSKIPLIVCANKIDKKRAVSEQEGRAWATAHGFSYFETSASSGTNVNEVFEELFKTVVDCIKGNMR